MVAFVPTAVGSTEACYVRRERLEDDHRVSSGPLRDTDIGRKDEMAESYEV